MTNPAWDGSQLLLDTHTLIWLLEGNHSLGTQARRLIDAAAQMRKLLVAAITPWEVAMLVQKGRLALSRDVQLWIDLALAHPAITLIALDPAIAVASTRLPFEIHADPADRLIVATTRHSNAILVTADRLLLDLARQGHFRAVDAAR